MREWFWAAGGPYHDSPTQAVLEDKKKRRMRFQEFITPPIDIGAANFLLDHRDAERYCPRGHYPKEVLDEARAEARGVENEDDDEEEEDEDESTSSSDEEDGAASIALSQPPPPDLEADDQPMIDLEDLVLALLPSFEDGNAEPTQLNARNIRRLGGALAAMAGGNRTAQKKRRRAPSTSNRKRKQTPETILRNAMRKEARERIALLLKDALGPVLRTHHYACAVDPLVNVDLVGVVYVKNSDAWGVASVCAGLLTPPQVSASGVAI